MGVVDILTPVLLVTIAIGVTAALIAWRERAEPGAMPLVAMLTGQVAWSAFLVFKIRAPTIGAKIFWEQLTWVGVVVIPVGWLLFALEYTGRDQYVQLRYVSLLLVVPVATVVLALTSQTHDLLYVQSQLVEFQDRQFLDRRPGPWLWVITAYTYLLGVLGSIPLLDLVRGKATTFRGQSGALLLGTLAPWVSNVLFLAGMVPIPALDPTPIAFSISGVAYLGAVTQFRLFGTNPSASQHARRLLIDQLREGAVVVDTHDFVVDINDSAARILGVDRQDALGERADEIVPQYDALEHDTGTGDQQTIRGDQTDRLYDVTRTEITDSRDRSVGKIFTLHDISDHVRNQQRHRVLNRLFRHNIRTETNLIISHAELLEGGVSEGEATSVKESALRVEETAEKTREIIDLFEQSRRPTAEAELSALLDSCLELVGDRYPEVAFETGTVPDDVYVDDVFETVFINVLDNAAAHNDTDPDPRVWVFVEENDDTVTVEVADNGPGIDEYEQSVIERGTEDALQHGSGLGLWLVKWGTEIADGDITFTDNDPSGTVVTITAPKLDAPVDDGTDSLREAER